MVKSKAAVAKRQERIPSITLYIHARQALVEAYWQIGKRVVVEEQHGEANAIYGDHPLARLSHDLPAKLGSRFSERNLYNTRQFYLGNSA